MKGRSFQVARFKREVWRHKFSKTTFKISKLPTTWHTTSSLHKATFNWLRYLISNIKCRCLNQVSNIKSNIIITLSLINTPILALNNCRLEYPLPFSTILINTTSRHNMFQSLFSNYAPSATIPTLTTNSKKIDFTSKLGANWLNFSERLRTDYLSQSKQELFVSTWFAKLREIRSQNWVCRLMCMEAWQPNSQLIHQTWTLQFTEFNPKHECKPYRLCTKSFRDGCRSGRIPSSQQLRFQ